MRQEINLLGTPRRRSHDQPTALQATVFLGVVLALGLGSGLWLNLRANGAEKRITAATAAIDDLILSLQERSQFLAQRNADSMLVTRLQELERETTDKGRVLDTLDGKTLGNATGFSAQLAALGRRHPDGLWLRQVQIGDGGRQVSLRGRAVAADLVPRFIDALQTEPAFQGTAFAHLAMTRPQNGAGPVSFSLATSCGEPGADGEAAGCADAAAEDAP